MSAGLTITGIAELDRKFSELPRKAQTKCLRPALNAALTIEVKAMKAAAPVGPTGLLQKTIGKRLKIKRDGTVVAKAGINVGKRSKVSKALKAAGISVKSVGRSEFMRLHNQASIAAGLLAPHSHLVALGTQPRFTRSGAYRGVMPPNPFIRRAAASANSAAQSKIEDVVRKNLEKEVSGK